jgi:hypothetical protein
VRAGLQDERLAGVFACSTDHFVPPDMLTDWSSHSAQVANILSRLDIGEDLIR